MYAELDFVRPDGSLHRALAFVDMGSPSMELFESLYRDLQLDQKKPLVFRVGDMTVRLPAVEVISEHREPYPLGPHLKVEATLPADVLRKYLFVIDYNDRTITLAPPGSIRPPGIPTPFRIHPKTGLIAIDATIDGRPYAITIDNGSAYTWFRQSTAKAWLVDHPEWQRGVGAVGMSNMRMSDDGTEASGILMRIPAINAGPLTLEQVGVLALGPAKDSQQDFFDWYSTKNAVPVIGWLGGNVLKQFRLTIDYPNRTIYWLKQTDPDSHDMDQVGVTLMAKDDDFIIAGIATKNGKPTVENIQPGDKLLRIDNLETKHASWGAIYSALHGNPGEIRTLVIGRAGHELTVPTKITAF
jgi:hypothetical protein